MGKKRELDNLKNVDLIIDICLKKLDGLCDYTWEDIVRMFNLDMSESHLRKMAYGMRIYRDYIEVDKAINSPSTLERYRNVIGNMECKRLKMANQRRELNKLKKDFNNSLAVVEELHEYYDKNGLELIIKNYEEEVIPSHRNTSMVIHITDWHIGAIINECKGNNYNVKIARDRIQQLYNEAIEMIDNYDVNEIYVISTGDMVEHDNMRQSHGLTVEFPLAQQITECQKLIFEFLVNLSKITNVNFGMVRGNHSRIQGDKRIDFDNNNVDIIINENIEYMVKLANIKRINVLKTDYKELNLRIGGLNCKFLHGDDKARDSHKLLTHCVAVENDLDVIFRGHWHNFQMVNGNYGKTCITSGCLSGYNEYSTKLGCTSEACQTIIIIRDGRIKAINNVILK